MRACWILAVLLAVPNPDADDTTKERDKLQGLWRATALEYNGESAPAAAAKQFHVKFDGDKISFNPMGENRTHTYVPDPKAKPKAMDMTAGDGPKKGQKLPCAIYDLDGDKLRICIDKEGEAGRRPTEFKTAPGSGFALITLERVTAAK
jgi:uncharacterized protein (TIGR03067 family)